MVGVIEERAAIVLLGGGPERYAHMLPKDGEQRRMALALYATYAMLADVLDQTYGLTLEKGVCVPILVQPDRRMIWDSTCDMERAHVWRKRQRKPRWMLLCDVMGAAIRSLEIADFCCWRRDLVEQAIRALDEIQKICVAELAAAGRNVPWTLD